MKAYKIIIAAALGMASFAAAADSLSTDSAWKIQQECEKQASPSQCIQVVRKAMQYAYSAGSVNGGCIALLRAAAANPGLQGFRDEVCSMAHAEEVKSIMKLGGIDTPPEVEQGRPIGLEFMH